MKNALILVLAIAMFCIAATSQQRTVTVPALPKVVYSATFIGPNGIVETINKKVREGFVFKDLSGGGGYKGSFVLVMEKY